VSAPHDGILCQYCHVGTDYEAAIPDSKCDVCHTPGGSLKPSYPTAQDVLSFHIPLQMARAVTPIQTPV
jgi:hypothetical protein